MTRQIKKFVSWVIGILLAAVMTAKYAGVKTNLVAPATPTWYRDPANLTFCTVGALAILFTSLKAFTQKNNLLLIAIAISIASVIFFHLTENFQYHTIYIDNLTVTSIFILLLGSIGTMLSTNTNIWSVQ